MSNDTSITTNIEPKCPWDEDYTCEYYPKGKVGCDGEPCEFMAEHLNNSSISTNMEESE